MTLRLRLLLGYGYLVALLLLATGSAVLGFFHLSAGIGAVLDQNYRSIEAAMVMMEALERQDSATLAVLMEGRAPGPAMAEHESDFREALAEAAANPTEPGETEVLAAIGASFEAYRRARQDLLADRPDRLLAAYNDRVFPRFSQVKGEVIELLSLNQRAMIRADREAREAAIRNGTWLGFLVVVALVSLVFLSRVLQTRILARLDALSSGTAAMSAGRRLRLRERGRDELGVIARNFNEVLDRYERLEAAAEGRIAQERRLVLALAGALGDRAVLLGLSGEVLAGEPPDDALRRELSEWIRSEGRERAAEADTDPERLSVDGREVRLELLVAPGRRPAGWLAIVS